MAQLIDQVAFFEKYNIKEEDFSNTKLTWEELSNIYNDSLLSRKSGQVGL